MLRLLEVYTIIISSAIKRKYYSSNGNDKAHALMVKVMDEMRYKMGGFQTKQQKANMKLMVRELFNEKTNKMAAELGCWMESCI